MSAHLCFLPYLADKIRTETADFIVTGGSGWMGKAVLEMLESALGDDVERRVVVFGSSNRNLTLRSGRVLACSELKSISAAGVGPKFLIHCAFLTKDKLNSQSFESFIAGNQAITNLVRAWAETADVRGIFTPSSGAVYKKGTKILDSDLQNNAYGAMKIADEKVFTEYAAARKIPLCMPRLFNLSGPFINKHNLYALASMIKAVLAGQSIQIHAAHRVVRSYIHVVDLVALAFGMLLQPRSDDAPVFDTAGEDVVELDDLADAVRKSLGEPEWLIERPPLVTGHEDVYVGDATEMRRMLQLRKQNVHSLREQICDTASYMQEISAAGTANR